MHVNDEGLWSEVIGERAASDGKPALFLDRDGVIVEEVNYLHRVQDIRFIPGAIALIKRANDLSIPVIVITNQSGIGRLYYTWKHFAEVQAAITQEMNKVGAQFSGVFACPFHSEARKPYLRDNHPARKPNPGMPFLARDELGIELDKSWVVGDRAIDVRAGRNAGMARGIHVATGHGSRGDERESALALATEKYRVTSTDKVSDLMGELHLLA